ncbi:MAG TPA: serine/threonine-protein kinase PknK, partial [Acetobacteraceae bacterium]|nr:serine/threonine-protein kinase PknK [Acetobacteraceae bacterium]
MNPSFRARSEPYARLQIACEDGERVVCRGWRSGADGKQAAVLAVLPAAEHPTQANLERLAHEYALKDELDAAWAARPIELGRDRGRTMLVLEDPGGEPLAGLLGAPMALACFLRAAIGIAAALGNVHQRGIVHKDIKPANILVDRASGRAWLTGFGLASRLPCERQAPEPPETFAGTLAYMAPEQTGRMNRSIDSRTDLYALGVTLYEMLTGGMPFTATEPIEWVHVHLARRPTPPVERVTGIPEPVSAIVMKLLAKTAEDRYQTAAGLERDLHRCLHEWQTRGTVDEFPLGEHDLSDRLLIPERLYGRERETHTLLAAFDRVAASGRTEFVLASGHAGIGKSALIHQLQRVVVSGRGLFAWGKFDQYRRDIPYASLAQALDGLVRPLLGRSEAELGRWRDSLQEAVGPNGELIIKLVPALELVLGPQPHVPDLPARETQHRFQLVFQRFLGAFAGSERPLVLFLDDLQWLDPATLDLLEHLATHPELRHVLLVGAYRDNEVTPAHQLMRLLAAIRAAGGRVQEIVVPPLGREHVGRLIADALHCAPERPQLLTRLVHEKTEGNPFFVIQFLGALVEEGLLAFDHANARWCWDLDRIRAQGLTDDVVELMLGKLGRLPEATQAALRELACLGSGAAIPTLTMVHGASEAELHAALWDAVRAGLVLRTVGAYRFLHDRVQEAAYALIPEGERDAEHLRIGRLLASRMAPEAIGENVFEIVNQLNRAAARLATPSEREEVAALNLTAARRAQGAAAHEAALTHFVAAEALLSEGRWERSPDLAFGLALNRAECEFVTGALPAAEVRLSDLARRAASLPDLAAVTRLRVELFMALGQSDRSVELALDYLGRVGVHWSAHPTQEAVRQEYERIWQQLGGRPIEALLELAPMTDRVACGTMDVLGALVGAALHIGRDLHCLVVGRMVNLSLEHGNGDASCYAYAVLGTVLGPRFGDYKDGFRFGQLGLDLVERRGLRRFQARVRTIFGGLVIPWTQPIQTGFRLLQGVFDAAHQAGDLTFAGYSRASAITLLLASGHKLAEVRRQAESGLAFARQARFGHAVDRITGQLQLIRTLCGLTPDFGCLNDAEFDESRFERHLEQEPLLSIGAFWYWTRKLQARFLAGDHAAAVAAAAAA